jgi:O-antigen/teichoic acid export membrane protein
MSLKRNIIANYVSQIYVTLIGIVMVPMYVQYMGAEAYGLIGFFAMLQAWFQLLDMGLTPTMARETSRYNGGAIDALSLRRLLRAMEGIFVGVAIFGCSALMISAEYIAGSWLKVEQLPLLGVQHSIMLIALMVALRWVCGLYRGAINGFERMVWLSGFNIAMATARFVLVIPFFVYVGSSPTQFFGYQLALAVIEVAVLITQTYILLPKVARAKRTPWQWAPLREVLRFSLSIAFTGSIWVLVTQTDKLVLSKLLPLSEYAYFTLAVMVAGGVGVISGPISGALLPRMSKLAAERNDLELIRLYRNATQLVGVIAIPAALVLGLFAEQVLLAWTGDAYIAHKAAPVLALYSLGNGILALAAFPYYLQFANGDLRLHLIGNAIFVMLLIPTLIWATLQYGVIGAGFAWLGANAVYFLAWVPNVHHRLVKGLHTQWLLRDVGPIVSLTVLGSVLAKNFVGWSHDRLPLTIEIAALSLAMVTLAAVGSSLARKTLCSKWSMHFHAQGK